MMNTMVWVWLAVMAVAVFLEMSTMALVSVWCAVGALVSVFAAYFDAPLAAQLIKFCALPADNNIGFETKIRRN